MSDERSDAAGEGEAGDGGARGRTTVATRPVNRPSRPTGKRTRQQPASAAAGVATELTESAAEIAEAGETGKASGKAKKAKKAGGPSRNPIAFVYNYLKQVVAELRKVIWPNRKQMITYTSVVLAFLVFMVALIAGADYGFARLVLLIFGGER